MTSLIMRGLRKKCHDSGTCLACGKEHGGLANEFGEGFSALCAGGSQTGQDFPGACAAAGFIAARKLSGDHCRPQLSLGEVLGGLDLGIVQECEQMVPLLKEPQP